jgi:hypothetical protein
MAGVEYPQNDFVNMIEAVARRNAAGGGVPGMTGEPQPAVRSRDLGQIIERNTVVDAPLTPQERHELDQAAIAAGIRDVSLGNTGAGAGDASQDQYGSLEAAMSAGASVRVPAPEAPSVEGAGLVLTRQNQRGPVVRSAPPVLPPAPPRLPDFRNVQGIDLISGVVYVDDMEFKMLAVDLLDLRQYAVNTARAEIMRRLDEAVSLFSAEMPEATDGADGNEEVSGVQGDSPEGNV